MSDTKAAMGDTASEFLLNDTTVYAEGNDTSAWGLPQVVSLAFLTRPTKLKQVYSNLPLGPYEIIPAEFERAMRSSFGNTGTTDRASSRMVNTVVLPELFVCGQKPKRGQESRVLSKVFSSKAGEDVDQFLNRSDQNTLTSLRDDYSKRVVASLKNMQLLKDNAECLHVSATSKEEYENYKPTLTLKYDQPYMSLEELYAQEHEQWAGWTVGEGEIYTEDKDGTTRWYIPSLVPPPAALDTNVTTMPSEDGDTGITEHVESEAYRQRRQGCPQIARSHEGCSADLIWRGLC
ncbi:uncharacterized protein L199_006985 [Kwoniella botswanensis]|uniref:uncharacterized protein n=1 Tax=Kwoniella botswanensis TaxID=1268659 RepID=UPI00315D4393